MTARALAAALAVALAGAPVVAGAGAYDIEVPAVDPGQPRIILARRPGRTAIISISFDAGGVEDGGQPGLTRLTQHVLLAANRRVDHTALMLAVHASAGSLALETRQRDCSFTLTADRRDFTELARQLATAVLSPQPEARSFPAAQARALADVRKGGGQSFLSQVSALVVDDSRYQNEPYGDREALEALVFDEVMEHLRGPLAPANATVVVAGAFDRDEVLRLLRGFRGGQAAAASRPTLGLPFRTRRAARKETHLLAYPVLLRTAREAAAARLATALLDDELWRRFRQAGVGYSYAAAPLRSAWLDLLVVLLPAHDPSSLELAPHLLEAFRGLRSGGYDDAQLARARGAAMAQLAQEDSNPAALVRALTDGGVTWHGRAVADELAALDRSGLTAVVGPWLVPERSISVYLGPRP